MAIKRKLLWQSGGLLMLTLLLLLSVTPVVRAIGDWTANGNNIYYSGGNVGIGTSSPTGLLTLDGGFGTPASLVQGQLGGGATLEFTSRDAAGNQATRMLLRGNTNTADLELYTGARGSEQNAFLYYAGGTGSVGVGKFVGTTAGNTVPRAKLHIKENGWTGLLLEDETQAGGSRVFRTDVYNGRLNFQAMADNGTTWVRNLMTMYHNGDVCIGSGC